MNPQDLIGDLIWMNVKAGLAARFICDVTINSTVGVKKEFCLTLFKVPPMETGDCAKDEEIFRYFKSQNGMDFIVLHFCSFATFS